MKNIFVIIFVSIISLSVYSQRLTVNIELNSSNYRGYGWGEGKDFDTIFIITRIKNISSSTVLYRNAPTFYVKYAAEDNYSWSHCFWVHTTDRTEERYLPDYERTMDNFIEIKPGEEIINKEQFSIGWICRGAPPHRPWDLYLFYGRESTSEDNYYMFKSYYTEKYEKVFVDAWTGKLESNAVPITIK
jgi:hypothetical protein